MAQAKLDYVRQVSEQLGLSFLDTAEGAKKLFAAAAGTPVEKEANMVFKAFSDMSAAMKLTGDETKGVFLALSQMISKGKVSAEELRQQLAERMPGAVNLFARSIGKTTQELDKMLQKGEVTLEHFLMFSREVQNTYGAGAIAAGGSLQAELNRLQNVWVDFKTSMTDTDTLASGVRSLTSMFKTLSPVIEFISKHIHTLTTVALAGWIGSSLAPGGKLRGVLSSIGDAAGKARERVEAFNKGQQAMVIRATGASAAVGKLRAALAGLGSGALYASLFAIGAGLLEIAYNAAKASRGFQDVSKNMSEYVAEMAKTQEAMEKSNFTPTLQRRMLTADTEKIADKFNKNYDKNTNAIESAFSGGSFGDLSGLSAVRGLRSQDSTKGIAEEAHRQAGEFWKSFIEAINKGDDKAAAEIRKNAVSAWENGIGKSVESLTGALGADLNAEWGAMLQSMGSMTANLTKYLNTFSGESADAAKRLGLNAAQIAEDFKKIKEAAEKTDIGKALAGLDAMDKLRTILGDTSIAFTDNAASIVANADKLQSYVEKVNNASAVYEQHKLDLQYMFNSYTEGSGKIKELEDAQKGLAGESEEVARRQQELKDWVVNCANAAGGSKVAYDTMVAVLQAVGQQCQSVSGFIQGLISDIYALSEAGARALAQAQGLSILQGARMQVINTGASQALANGDKEGWKSFMRDQAFTQAEGKGKRFIATREFEGQLDEAWGFLQQNRKMQEAFKAAHKKGGGKGSGGKRVDNTAEKWKSAEEGWRKKIADMQGQKDVQTLAKDFADMDKQLKGSSVDMKALKKDYLEAFSGKYANDLNKELLQLRGNEAELAKIDIEEKYKAKAAAIEGMAEEAKKLGITVEDYTPKLAEYRKLLEGQAREQQLQKELPYYEKFSWFDGMKSEALAKQNELIAIQAEKMKGTIPDELIDRWRQIEELQNRVKNGNDVIAGVALGAKKYALEMGNFAENVSDLVNKSFGDMADAFTDFVMTGKANFTDLANSIIKDLMRIAIQQAIVGPIANGIGNLFGGLFNLGGSSGPTTSSGVVTPSGFGVGAGIEVHALGGAFTGLHGFSNQIVNRPTLFSYGSQLTKFAKGGVMGEAGPEAVMPLTRTASGHLGVRSDGSNAPIVNVVINNSTGQQASQRTKTDNQGNKSIEVMIGDMAAQQMLKSGSSLNRAVRTFSGQSQQVTRR
jgi:lambda family phage tail tape measure protein